MNAGKIFEQQIKKSVPDYCLLYRLKDEPQSFTQSKYSKYSHKNPFDFFMFDTLNKVLYCIEAKSTKQKYISYERLDEDKEQNKMIHKHQINGLLKYSKYENVKCGFLLNFRDEINNMERTYFLDINDFLNIYNTSKKSSLNEIDIIKNNGIKIYGEKKRVNYVWNLDKFCIENSL